jgi:hypothetical protein
MRVVVCSLIAVLLGQAATTRAEEKNGLMVTVQKKTLERNDSRAPYYYSSDRIDRTQGLKVTVKNTSFREMPAGEIAWTLLVRKYYSSAVEGYTGKEPLKALKPSEMTELVLGAAQIQGWADISGQAKDKIEHQIVVTQDGKETMRLQSTSGFDAVAKRAVFQRTPVNRGPPKEATPAPAGATPRPGATPGAR